MKTPRPSLLIVLVNNINDDLAKTTSNDRLEITFEGSKVNIQRVTRGTSKANISKVFILISATLKESHNYIIGFQTALLITHNF